MKLDDRTAAVIRDCIVPIMRPLQIVVFGSYARGDATENSDIDIAVIVPTDVGTTLLTIARCDVALHKVFSEKEIDLLVHTEQSYNEKKDVRGSVFYDVSREGIVIYRTT